MENLEFNFGTSEPVVGKCLDPQPPKYADCISSDENEEDYGTFGFYVGNPDYGDDLVHEVKTNNPNIEPRFDDKKDIWVWDNISEETVDTRNWYKEFNNRTKKEI